MSKNLSGKWAVVTGASGGIGLQFCNELAAMGCNLVMVAIENDMLEGEAIRISKQFGITAHPLTLDLTRNDAPAIVLGFITAKNIEPYILINNAGIFSFSPVEECTETKLNRYIDLHVRITTLLSRSIGAMMKRNGRGHILNMSSMSCWTPMPGIAMYSATKAYIRVFSRALHYELKDYGVSVTVACPGGIATDLFGLPENLKQLALRIGAIQRPEKFARTAIRKMLAGRQQYINGLINRLSIFLIGITPTSVRMLIKHKMLDQGIRV